MEVDAFHQLCHSPFDYHVRVSQKKVLTWSTRLPVTLHWSLRPDSRCCRIEYHYEHYLDFPVHHNCTHAPCFSLFSHRILYFRGYWLKDDTYKQFLTGCPFSFIVNRDQREQWRKQSHLSYSGVTLRLSVWRKINNAKTVKFGINTNYSFCDNRDQS